MAIFISVLSGVIIGIWILRKEDRKRAKIAQSLQDLKNQIDKFDETRIEILSKKLKRSQDVAGDSLIINYNKYLTTYSFPQTDQKRYIRKFDDICDDDPSRIYSLPYCNVTKCYP